jgi:hypothetical protein
MLDQMTLRLAAKIDARLERDYAGYLEACEQDRREGHRPHYCEHGTDLWTDYDPMCGLCEDGDSSRDPLQRRAWAIIDAKARVNQFRAALDWYSDAPPGFDRFVNRDEFYARATQLITMA